jgi:hypothetical protein
VRIFDNGVFAGGGTLVNRNWVLATRHQFFRRDNPTSYALEWGVVTNHNEPHNPANQRIIDHIEWAPQGDLALVHFADPIDAWTPHLASAAPLDGDWAHMYGWGPDGDVLNRVSTVVYDPAASSNAAFLRSQAAIFAADFPAGIDPMVLTSVTSPGDSGSGVFSPRGVLAGVYWGRASYRDANSSGHLSGVSYTAPYDQPVWLYRQWILDTISGAGPSTRRSSPADGEPLQRRLDEDPGGGLPMTPPPQTDLCDEGDEGQVCSGAMPDPVWARGVLLGSGNYRGTALGRCATAAGNRCSFDGVAVAAGASYRMRLGPSSAPDAPGTRQVMAWCTTTAPFPDPDSPAQPVVRVSLTNADPRASPIGYGWWDVTPGQVGTGTGQTLVDAGQLASC